MVLRSSWLHHIKELFVINQSILILISLIQNILQIQVIINSSICINRFVIETHIYFLLSHRFTHKLHHQPQLFSVNITITILEL